MCCKSKAACQNFSESMRIPLLLAPALTVIIGLFMGGLGLGLAQSLGYMPVIGAAEVTFEAYRNLWHDPTFWQSLLLTLWISFITTLLSAVLAVICALTLRRSGWGQKGVAFIFQLNVPVPHLVGAIAIAFLLTPSGWLARLAYLLGLTATPAEFPSLVYDRYAFGIVVEYLWKAIPFTGVILLAVLQSLGEDYEAQAQTLGANRWQRFWYVLLPLLLPGLLRASILVFAFTFGAYEVPLLLGQKYPPALPVLAFEYYQDVDLGFRREAMAICMIITLLSTLLILMYIKLTETYVRTD